MIVLGIDVSTKRIAISDGTRCDSIPVGQFDKGSRRLADMHARSKILLRQFANGRQVRMVFVEAPAGTHVHPSLMHSVGVVLAAVTEELDVPARLIPVGSWKLASMGPGQGAATKDRIWEWARQKGSPSNQDEADALGIAVAGAVTLDTEDEVAA